MFVKLFTGLPGAGKTAQLVAAMLKSQQDEPHRPLFAMGINGLAEGIATSLSMDQLHEWWELPPGSIICIDECQEEGLMPKDRGNPSTWVQRIAKVRHHGMTFMLTTQHPQNMSAYVRRLVDQHVHTANKFGTSVIARYTWGRCMDDPEKGSVQKAGVEDLGTLPKEVFDLYKSSSLHTRKRRIPRKVYMLVALVVIGVAAAVTTPFLLKRASEKNVASMTGQGVADAGAKGKPDAQDRAKLDDDLRTKDYPKWLAPRVEGQPWTAPAFDHLAVQAQPRIFCVANEDGGCHCRTEQGTKYTVKDSMCRVMVQEGGVYNPFQPPADLARGSGEQSASPPPDKPQAPPVGSTAMGATAPGSGSWNRRVGQAVYTPPELSKVSDVGG
jgi:hypothetical protein